MRTHDVRILYRILCEMYINGNSLYINIRDSKYMITICLMMLVSIVCTDVKKFDHVSIMNFDRYLDEHADSLIYFYETWCKECEKFDPVFSNLADALAKQYEGLRVAKVDTEGDQDFLDLFHIKVYPQLIYFHKGLPIPFKDLLDGDKIKQWVNVVRVRKPHNIESISQLKELTFPLIYLFTADETSSRFRLIDNLAKKTEDTMIFYSTNEEVLAYLNITHNNTLDAISMENDGFRLSMTGEYDFFGVSNFLVTSRFGILTKFDTEIAKDVIAKGVPILLVFAHESQGQQIQKDLLVGGGLF